MTDAKVKFLKLRMLAAVKLINERGFLQNNGGAHPLQKLKRRKQTSIQSR
jgi:hypothetical protein